jgi:outer membrane lipoprotein-sorting protein
MKNLSLSAFFLFFSILSFAQIDTITKDPRAKVLLDQLSIKTKEYGSLRVKFSYTLENAQKKSSETYDGYVYLKGSKYKLILPGNEVFSDGKTVWTYLKDAGEINVTEPDADDESVLNPSKMFTLYEKGFKFKMIGESNVKGVKCSEIHLYPENPKNKKYSIVKLFIDKLKMQINTVKYMAKDGNNYSIEIKEFKPDAKIGDNLFVYDKTKFPKDVQVNDLRDK